jgi:uncharacterized protein (TIGR00255 family)
VNRKSLEVAFSAPREWQGFEPEITAAVREKAARGRVQVAIEVRGPAATGLTWDDAAVSSVLDRLAAFAAKRGVAFAVTPDLLLGVAQASRTERVTLESEKALALIRAALEPALREFATSREREGAALGRDFAQRAASLQAMVERIASRTAGATQNYRENLLTRLRQAGLELDLEDERVLREIALFADRIDISEELTRLRSHLEHFGQLLTATEAVGRKLEFLLQEIGREIHTIGSKANDLEAARLVIECKNELERIREQAQNVE